MKKEDIINKLEDFAKKNNPYLYGSHTISKPCLHSEAWRTGGVGGGSCWDDGEGEDPHYELDSDNPETITILEQFLEEFYPHLSLSQYKGLMLHVRSDDWSEYEYYGNYTNYECAYITFEDIAEYLVNLKNPKLSKSYRKQG
jgi:hypothetical protein